MTLHETDVELRSFGNLIFFERSQCASTSNANITKTTMFEPRDVVSDLVRLEIPFLRNLESSLYDWNTHSYIQSCVGIFRFFYLNCIGIFRFFNLNRVGIFRYFDKAYTIPYNDIHTYSFHQYSLNFGGKKFEAEDSKANNFVNTPRNGRGATLVWKLFFKKNVKAHFFVKIPHLLQTQISQKLLGLAPEMSLEILFALKFPSEGT